MEALFQTIEVGLPGALLTILRERRVHQPQEFVVAEWFGQKIEGSRLDGAHARWDVAVAGDKDDRRVISLRQLSLQIQAVDVGKFDIEDQAGRYIGFWMGAVFGGGSERD